MINKERDLCIKAVRKDGLVLQFVHPDIIDEHICLEAIKQNGLAFIYIPKTLITLEMVTHYCLSKHCNLQLVPKRYLTETICIDAVKQDITNIAYMPKRFVTEELWKETVKELPHMFQHVVHRRRIRFVDQELCNIAIKANKWNIHHVPKKFQTKEMLMEYVKDALI
jgi:hypothetical protein